MLAMFGPGIMELIVFVVVVVAVIFAIVGTIRKYVKPAQAKTLACPKCGGWSKANASNCEHCGTQLPQDANEQSPPGA